MLLTFLLLISSLTVFGKSSVVVLDSESKESLKQAVKQELPKRELRKEPQRLKERELRRDLKVVRVERRKDLRSDRKEKTLSPREKRRVSFIKRKLMKQKDFGERMQGLKRRERHKTPEGGQRFQAQRRERRRRRLNNQPGSSSSL